MFTGNLETYDHDSLCSCPFCEGTGLWVCDVDDCPHYVVAFQDGDWDPDLCPPVSCYGFRFDRGALTIALAKAHGVVCKKKPGTPRHPRIAAYYCVDTALAAELRDRHRKSVVGGVHCHWCGNDTAVLGEHNDIRCSICGDLATPTALEQ